MKLANKINREKIQQKKSEFVWIFSYGKKHILAIILYTAMGLSSTLVGLLNSLQSKDLVDIITGHNTGAVVVTFATIIGLQLISVLIGQISGLISTIVINKLSNSIKADMYDKIMATEWESLSAYHSGDIISRWSGDSTNIASGILTFIPDIVQIIFRFGSAFILVFSYDPSFVIFALVGAPISLLATRKNMSRMKKVGMSSLQINSELSTFSTEAFSNFQYVKAFNLSKLYSRRIRELNAKQTSILFNQQKMTIFNSLWLTIITSAITYTTYGWGIYKVWSGAITYGTMTMFLAMSGQLTNSLQSLLGILPAYNRISNSAKRLMDVVELPKEDLSLDDEVASFAKEHVCDGVGLSVNNMSYAYMNGTQVFDKVDFRAIPNEVVALVGPSGEGKTTMLRVLLALVKVQDGSCRLISGDGENEMELTASARQLFSYVPQGNTMFSGTIADNMRYIKEDATDEEIIEVLKLACAWEFVEKLPDGINTVIRERGLGLSEGQAQRLSIARALIRKSPILLLDEATSALDVYTEKQLLENLLNDDYPRTTIVTAHRLSVLKSCNRVYKIHDKECHEMSASEIEELMSV